MLINIPSLSDIGRSHWLKLLIAILILMTLLRKDLNFQIRFNAPEHHAVPIPTKKQKEVVKQPLLSQENRIATTDILSLNPFSNSKKTTDEDVFWSIDKDKHRAFIRRFKKVAEAESKKFDIPAAIILANGLLLSGAGTQEIAAKGNNYFAIPCTEDWLGKTQEMDGICYRVYDRAWTSFRDHSFYLTTTVAPGHQLPAATDYEAWAKLLELVGFVSDRQFLIRIIHEYELQR